MSNGQIAANRNSARTTKQNDIINLFGNILINESDKTARTAQLLPSAFM